MAFVHSIFASPNHPIFSPNILAVKLTPEHAHCSKSHNIHIPKSGKVRVRVTLCMLYMRVFEIIL